MGFHKRPSDSSTKASLQRSEDNINTSAALNVIESNESGWFKARHTFSGAYKGLQSLLGPCNLVSASQCGVEQKQSELANHPRDIAPCPEHLPDLSQARSSSLEWKYRRPTHFLVEIRLIPLIRKRLRGAYFEWKTSTETEVRACTSHLFPA